MSDDKALVPEVVDDPEVPEGCYIDSRGCLREEGTARLVKGTKALNPSGKPGHLQSLRKKLQSKFGKDGRLIAEELYRIITYDQAEQNDRFEKVKVNQKLEAIKIVLSYQFGKAPEQIEVDQNVEMTVSTKMHDIAKLISDNKSINLIFELIQVLSCIEKYKIS